MVFRQQETSVEARLEGGAGRRLGYLRLTSFTARTQPDVAAAIKRLEVRCRARALGVFTLSWTLV